MACLVWTYLDGGLKTPDELLGLICLLKSCLVESDAGLEEGDESEGESGMEMEMGMEIEV